MTLAHGATAKGAQSPLLSAALYDIMIQHWGEFDVAAAKLLLLGRGLCPLRRCVWKAWR